MRRHFHLPQVRPNQTIGLDHLGKLDICAQLARSRPTIVQKQALTNRDCRPLDEQRPLWLVPQPIDRFKLVAINSLLANELLDATGGHAFGQSFDLILPHKLPTLNSLSSFVLPI